MNRIKYEVRIVISLDLKDMIANVRRIGVRILSSKLAARKKDSA